MAQARFLAPWHQPDLIAALEAEGLSVEELAALKGKPAIYHCVSRVVGREFRPGGAGNVATALAALEADVACFGLVSNDNAGGQLVEKLTESGVNTEGLLVDPTRPTTRKTRFVGLAQHKNPHQILREDEEDTTPVCGEMLDRFARLIGPTQVGPCLKCYSFF